MPPIGDLRFTFPQKIAPNGQKYYVGNNASNPYTDSICSQMDFHEVVTGQEDCLHLHVYVPETGKGQYNFYLIWLCSQNFCDISYAYNKDLNEHKFRTCNAFG